MMQLSITQANVQRALHDPEYFRGLFIQALASLAGGGSVAVQRVKQRGDPGADYVSLLGDPEHILTLCGGKKESAASVLEFRTMLVDALRHSDPMVCLDAFALAAIAVKLADRMETYLYMPPDAAAALGVFISRFSAAARWLDPSYTPKIYREAPEGSTEQGSENLYDVQRMVAAGANLDLVELDRIRRESEAEMRADLEERNRQAEKEGEEGEEKPPEKSAEPGPGPSAESLPQTIPLSALSPSAVASLERLIGGKRTEEGDDVEGS